MKRPTPGKIILIGFLTVFLTIALTFGLLDLTRNVIAIPVTRVFYFIKLLVINTPQSFFWAALLLLILISAMKSTQGLGRTVFPIDVSPVLKRDRVGFLARIIKNALNGNDYSRIHLADFMSGVVLDLFAMEERVPITELRAQVGRGELDAPLEIQDYLKTHLTHSFDTRPNLWGSIKGEITFFWKRLFGRHSLVEGYFQNNPTRLEVEKIIQYLEKRLEVTDDD